MIGFTPIKVLQSGQSISHFIVLQFVYRVISAVHWRVKQLDPSVDGSWSESRRGVVTNVRLLYRPSTHVSVPTSTGSTPNRSMIWRPRADKELDPTTWMNELMNEHLYSV